MCECCAKHDCSDMNLGDYCSIDPTKDYWHPGAGNNFCTFSTVTDPNMLANPKTYIFSSLCDCCAKHGCSGMNLGNQCSSSVTTTTSTSAITIGTTPATTTTTTAFNPSQSYWHPDGVGNNFCTFSIVTDSKMLANPSLYLFSSMCDCCAKYGCSGMNLGDQCPSSVTTTTSTSAVTIVTGITTSTTATTTMTIDPSKSYWYPELRDEINTCVFGMVTDPFLLKHSSYYLFSSMCDCCAKHDCRDMKLGDQCSTSNTTTTTTSTSTAATTSTTGTAVTTSTKATTATTAATTTTTTATTAGNGLVAYWFPVIDLEKKTLTCEFGTNYPQAMLLYPENQLFKSRSECEDFFDVTSAPTKAPVAALATPVTTTTSSTTAAVPTTTTSTTAAVSTTTTSTTAATTTATSTGLQSFWYSDIHADGNICVFGPHYEWWMATDAYRATQLFTTKEECCQKHPCDATGKPQQPPTDVVTFLDETFESGMAAVPWIHGGTATHIANWNVTTDKFLSGKYSMRSGDLNNNRGKSSDIRLKVDSSRGAQLKYSYYSDVGGPFDFFELKVDGELIEKEGMPSSVWSEHAIYLTPGAHEILLRVIAPPADPGFRRSSNFAIFGRGFVYVDNLQLLPL